ncbi:response regulator [Paenibacillus favisporus]|uniref:response regulator n=1 Tax=Paenibacillus favisporus TaxID=221028 RepID=UPI00198255F2
MGREFQNHEYQLVILDLMLPQIEGREVLRQILAKGTVPVIIFVGQRQRNR